MLVSYTKLAIWIINILFSIGVLLLACFGVTAFCYMYMACEYLKMLFFLQTVLLIFFGDCCFFAFRNPFRILAPFHKRSYAQFLS